jgi:hypothetical protein
MHLMWFPFTLSIEKTQAKCIGEKSFGRFPNIELETSEKFLGGIPFPKLPNCPKNWNWY